MRGPAQPVYLQDIKVLGGRMGVWRRMERLPLKVWKLHRFGVSTQSSYKVRILAALCGFHGNLRRLEPGCLGRKMAVVCFRVLVAVPSFVNRESLA